ncbi:hypothetical protein ACH47X_24555 [Promicromonospora kroppenstedtii]|uniref:Uncharacterized protein n=1 Tax=Promicromonospora kroppenstedtii TaxID=440482 RepID=A0ABW7XRC3_9MICO
MNEHQRPEDQAFERLTAADPARRAPGPADDVLRAKVDALIAGSGGRLPLPGPAASESVAAPPPGAPSVDELAVRRHRSRTPWLVAAAVAGVVAVGGGGYLLGESGSGALPAAMDSGAETGAAPEAREDGPSVMGAPDESGAAAEGVEPLTAGGDLGSATRLVFHAGVGLTDTPGTAGVRTAAGENLGEYPVVSEEDAVERLGDPRFAGPAPSARQSAPDEDAAPSPAPGGPIAWPVEDVTIVSAELTEVRYTLPDGAVLVVPAYELADAAGSSWTVLAVDEEALDFTP